MKDLTFWSKTRMFLELKRKSKLNKRKLKFNMKRKKTLLQTISYKISETFLCFRIVSITHKANRTRLSSSEVNCTSCLEQIKTYDLRKWENFRKIAKSSIGIVYARCVWKVKNVVIANEKWTKSAIKLFIKVQFYLISKIGLHIFCEGLQGKYVKWT